MSKFLRLGFLAIALTVFFGGFSAMETKAQFGPLNEILTRMDNHHKALKTLRSDIVMAKYNSQLDENDLYQGKTMYLQVKGRDPFVRIDWQKPREESLAVVNKQYVLFNKNLKQAIVGKVEGNKSNAKVNNALAFMNMTKQQLQANYEVKFLGEEKVNSGKIVTIHLQLIPKNTSAYKSANLWIDGNGMPVQAKVTEPNNDTTTILLTNLVKNDTIKPSVFKIDLPNGTKIIDG